MRIDIRFLIFGLLTIFWLAEFIVFPSPKNGTGRGNISFYLVLAGIVLSISFSVIMNLSEKGLITGNPGEVLRTSSLFLYLYGVFLRYRSSKLLGKNFSRNIKAEREQALVSSGPYRIFRHPLYIALMILVVSVSMFLQSFPGIIFSLVVMAVVLGIRINEEEKIMEDKLGERYTRWKDKRYILLPFIF